jgi:16S rRNA (uracil1498-N3)-methyltransferase
MPALRSASVIRLHVPDDLAAGHQVTPSAEQTHYLLNVMRVGVGEPLLLFNGRDGEWLGRLVQASKRACVLTLEARARPQTAGPDLDLMIALVKRARLDTIVEKAAELGARRVLPLITARTNADHVNISRLVAIAVEAAEQTGRLDTPEILSVRKLDEVLSAWDSRRRLMFCDEAGDAAPVGDALAGETPAAPWAILIGPEGGFSPAERARIRAIAGATPVGLGPRILRADTAAISAMTLWQAALGDWRQATADLSGA